jgi:hypothetical protein
VLRRIVALSRRRMTAESWRIFRLTMDAARSSESDPRAAEALALTLSEASAGELNTVMARLKRGSPSYLRNRAQRLLESVITGKQVALAPDEFAELFSREEQLGRLPMLEAYDRLSVLEPGLKTLEDTVRSWTPSSHEHDAANQLAHIRQQSEVRREAATLTGAQARLDDPILRSNIALSIAQRYLYALLGDTQLGDPDTPYFAAPAVLRSDLTRPKKAN